MNIIIYSFNTIKRYAGAAFLKNKRKVVVVDSVVCQLFCEIVLKKYFDKVVLLKNLEKENNVFFFVMSFRNVDSMCEMLRNHKWKEGIDFCCFRPKLCSFRRKTNRWEEIENFPRGWEGRTKAMVELFPISYDGIIDLGCGECKLKKYIEGGAKYIGVDYKKRNRSTVVADFNKKQFPIISQENKRYFYFCSGCIEYIKDIDWFVEKMTDGKSIVFSYCAVEHNRNMRRRQELAWQNHLTVFEIVSKMKKHHYICVDSNFYNGNVLFRFENYMNNKE